MGTFVLTSGSGSLTFPGLRRLCLALDWARCRWCGTGTDTGTGAGAGAGTAVACLQGLLFGLTPVAAVGVVSLAEGSGLLLLGPMSCERESRDGMGGRSFYLIKYVSTKRRMLIWLESLFWSCHKFIPSKLENYESSSYFPVSTVSVPDCPRCPR